jgi:hypothetical protein
MSSSPTVRPPFWWWESDGGKVVVSETSSGTSGVRMAGFAWGPAEEGCRQISEIRVGGLLRHRAPSEAYEHYRRSRP